MYHSFSDHISPPFMYYLGSYNFTRTLGPKLGQLPSLQYLYKRNKY